MPENKVNIHRKSKNSGSSVLCSYLKTQLVSLIVYIITFILACVICLAFDLNDNYDVYVSLFAFAAASLVSGYLGGIKTRKKGIVSGVIYSLPSNLILTLASLISGSFKADFMLFITVLTLIIAGAVGGILAVNKRRRR